MINFFKKLSWGILFALGFSAVFATTFLWTSFYKAGNPITLPATSFLSGWVVSENTTSGGTKLMDIWQSWSIYMYMPVRASNGELYVPATGVDDQLCIWHEDSLICNSTLVTGALVETDPVFNLNKGDYFEANSWTYYTINPLWYITWFTELDPIRTSNSGLFCRMNMTGNWNTSYSWGDHSWLYIKLDQTSPQTITWWIPLLYANRTINSEHQLVDKMYVDSMWWGWVSSRFFTKNASDISGMYNADFSLPTWGLQTITATVTDWSPVLVATFITNKITTPLTTVAWMRTFYINASTTQETKWVQLYVQTYKSDLSGENLVPLLLTNNSSPLLSTAWNVIIYNYGTYNVQPITERRVIKLYAFKADDTWTDPVVSVNAEDNTYSRLEVPIPSISTDLNNYVTISMTGNRNTAYWRGNHTTFWYLTSSINTGVIFNQRFVMEWSGMMWNDIQNLQMRDTDQAADKPSLTTISWSTIKTRCFDGWTAPNMMYGNMEIPHDMYVGTWAVLSPHVHWMWSTTSATTTGIWYLDYTIRKLNTVYSWTITISQWIYGITWREARLTEIDWDIDASNLKLWDTVSFRIYRTPTGADTYAGLMCLSQVWFHYQIDTLGSRQEYIK